MKEILNQNAKVKIVYYSGTGGSLRVTEYFAKTFREKGKDVSVQPLIMGVEDDRYEHDLLLLIYAVHACNAPKAIYDWIAKSSEVSNIPAVIISVSGGGEVSPNTACRLSCIKKLENKGYKVTYEEMYVMPSNWIVPTKEPLALMLLEILPKRVSKTVDNILCGVNIRTKPLLIDRFFSLIGEFEKIGARLFGKKIKVSYKCNSCAWCAKNCPSGNIIMNEGKPLFSNRCHLCLKCIYGCQSKALSAGIGKFIVIKEGYRLAELEKKLPFKEQIDVEELTKGYLWSGIRKYLSKGNIWII